MTAFDWPLRQLAARLYGDEDFSQPVGEPALLGPESVSWRVFANPVTMFVGGIAAVLLELGEPRVRHGVWDHSDFRRDPARRLRRTGLAAMVTVYGARSRFEALARRVRGMHARVTGTTAQSVPYRADDPELLAWVQATAAWGFLAAYRAYAAPLGRDTRDRYYAEGTAGAALYGVDAPPRSEAELAALFAAMAPRLEASPVLDELLAILSAAPILPAPLRPVQRTGVRAAVDLVPIELRKQLGIEGKYPVRYGERLLLKTLARAAERLPQPASPRAQALRRIAGTRRSSAFVLKE